MSEALLGAVPFLLDGARVTILLSVVALALGLGLGLLAAVARLAPYRPLRWTAQFYIDVVRGTPLLVQLFLIYYGLPQFGILIPAFPAAVIGLGMNYGAYLAEVFRGGLLAVDSGQWEAAASLGMSQPTMLRTIILPQAIRVALPGVGNYAISMLKDTALAATVTVGELVRQAQLRIAINFHSFEIYLVAALFYLVMSYPLTLLVKQLERRTSRGTV
jgi:His/Glu/Gln/Arg/opine family amino acid ABC transporter permease subunit